MLLNPSQQKAVEEDGIQLIIAGPGSGKTRVVTEKILHLIQNGVKPQSILALTFSDKAARLDGSYLRAFALELKEQLAQTSLHF
jgi:superfamily I DNA/RNA helicase